MISAPVLALISIPLWLLDAPSVGDSLSPKLEVILLLDGQGHLKLIFPKFDTVYVLPAASAFSWPLLPSASSRLDSSHLFFLGFDICIVLVQFILGMAILELYESSSFCLESISFCMEACLAWVDS
mgnify:CR=1 FL=1